MSGLEEFKAMLDASLYNFNYDVCDSSINVDGEDVAVVIISTHDIAKKNQVIEFVFHKGLEEFLYVNTREAVSKMKPRRGRN